MKTLQLNLLLAASLLMGCGGDGGHDGHDHGHGPGQHTHDDDDHGEEEHVHVAPHGGLLVVLGEEYAHLELVHDAEAGELRAYALGAHADSPVRLTQESITITLDGMEDPLVLQAVASALSGEKVGDTSEFLVANESLKTSELKSGQILRVEMLGQVYDNVAFGSAN